MRTFRLCLIVLLLTSSAGWAQKFSYVQYGARQGLPSDRAHAVVRDSLGFAWMATGKGLVRYDGQAFTRYPASRVGRSVLALHRSRSGKILFANDTGVFSVAPQTDTATVRRLVGARSQPTDSTVVDPDGLYRDVRGHLWISSSNGPVARLHKGRLRFFALGEDSTSDDAAPASRFLFAEDGQSRLWMLARTGQLYRYVRPEARFERVPLPASLDDARDLRIRNDTLWMAGDRLLRARITPSGEISDTDTYSTDGRQLTHVAFAPEGLLLSTQQNGLFWGEPGADDLVMQPVRGANDPHRTEVLPFRNIHHIYVDREGSIWLSSAQGVGLLQTRFFRSISSLTNYDTLFLHQEENGILVTFGDGYRVGSGPARTFSVQPLSLPSESVISSLASRGRTTWAATAVGKLLTIRGGRITRTYNFADRGGVIFNLFDDRRGNLWFCQAPADKVLKGVSKIGPNGDVTFYGADEGLDDRILSLREGPGGTLYAAGIGTGTYLYRYDPGRDRFVNLSGPLSFRPGLNFEVHDLAVGNHGTIWLATTDGLLRHDGGETRRVELGTYTEMEMRSVETMPNGDVWMATATDGLLHYRDGTWVQFDQDRGLISSVMVYRTLRADGQGRLWTGTEEGVVHSRTPMPTPEPTPTPRLLSAKVNGTPSGLRNRLSVRKPDDLSLRFAALTFPSIHLRYQYRLVGTADSSWSDSFSEPTLSLSDLPRGVHHVEIRARNGSGHYWSDPLRVPMYVRPVWYRTWWAYVLFVLGGIGALGSMVYLYAERKRAKQALQESQARLHGLAHSVPGVIFQFYARPDGEYGAHFVSQQSESVLGLDPEEGTFIERFLECVPPNHREDVFASVEDAVENKEQWSFEMPFVKPSGETIWIQGVSTLENRKDELVFNSVILDVTTRKHLESQLHQAHRLETVGTLAGGIAHDFNNILHTVSAYLELLRDEVPEAPPTRKYLLRMEKGLQQAETLADKLLTFSQPDSTTVRERVELGPLIRDTIDLASTSFSGAITLDVDLCGDCIVNGDPDQLRQVVLNLVTNAGRAMEADDDPPVDTGHVLGVSLQIIEVSADRAERHLALDPGVYAHLSVRDTGLGMDEDTAEHVFDPFFTNEEVASRDASSGTASSKRGAGLGLSVAYSAVEAHGGEITVDSEPGVGTTFDVYLPAIRSSGPQASPSERSADAKESSPA